jgi:hypothetical protein
MNCSGSCLYNGKSYEENPPSILIAAILTAVFYSVTALTTVVLRVVGMFGGRNRTTSPNSLFILDDYDEKEANSSAVSNVVDFQHYKLFRLRRD